MKIFRDYNLKMHNSYRLNSVCSIAIFPETEEELIECCAKYPKDKRVLIGHGNNILLVKDYYDKCFLILDKVLDKIKVEKNMIYVEAGASNDLLSGVAYEHSLTGLEFFWDIPSSLGGAVVMNAGASGEDISTKISSVKVFDETTEQIKHFDRNQMLFTYRNSIFQDDANLIVLSASIVLEKGNKYDIKNKMTLMRDLRWQKQPRDYPSGGSVFKRPTGKYVGQMIDQLGLRGFRVGSAAISTKHSGFIINLGEAKGSDIYNLITEVRCKVAETFGIHLEIEQRLIQ